MVPLPPNIKFEFFPKEEINKFYRTYLLRKINKDIDSRIILFLPFDYHKYNTLVLLDGLKIIGLSTFDNHNHIAESIYTCVDRDYQGKRLGTYLIWKRMEIMSQMGIKRLKVSPYSDNGRIQLAKNIWKFASLYGISVEDDFLDAEHYDSSEQD